jgi:hypothetical protein
MAQVVACLLHKCEALSSKSPKKLNIELPYDPKEMKSICQDIYPSMFIAVLFTLAKK